MADTYDASFWEEEDTATTAVAEDAMPVEQSTGDGSIIGSAIEYVKNIDYKRQLRNPLPKVIDTAGANFRQNFPTYNFIVNSIPDAVIEFATDTYYRISNLSDLRLSAKDHNFNLEERLKVIPEEDHSYFYDCNNDIQFDRRQQRLYQEYNDRAMLSELNIAESLINGGISLLDPVNFAMAAAAGGFSKGAASVMQMTKIASKTPKLMGTVSFAFGTAIDSATFLSTSASLSKATHLLEDETQWYQHFASAYLMNTLFRIKGFRKTEKFRKDLVNEVAANAKNLTDEAFTYVGSNRVMITDINNNSKIVPMNKMFTELYRLTPVGKAATSNFTTINKLGEMYFRTSNVTHGVAEGLERGSSIESLNEYYRGDQVKFWKSFATEHDSFVKRGLSGERKFLNGKKKDMLSDTFYEELRENILYRNESAHPEVNKAGEMLRQRQIEFTEQSNKYELSDIENPRGYIKQGFEKETEFIESPYLTKDEATLTPEQLSQNLEAGNIGQNDVYYFPRCWNIQACLDREPELLSLLEKGNVKRQFFETGKVNLVLAKREAQSQYDHIKSGGVGNGESIEKYFIEGISIGKYGHSRSVLIDDHLLTPFLETNPVTVMQQYERKVVPAIMAKRVLKENGYNSLRDIELDLQAEYENKRASTPSSTHKKLHEEHEEAKKLLRDIPELVMGTYDLSLAGDPNIKASLYALKQWNYARDMGMLLFTSLDNPVLLMNHFGLKDTLKAYGTEFKNSIQRLYKKGQSLSNEQSAEFERCGVAIEMERGTFADDIDRIGSQAESYRVHKYATTAVKVGKKVAYYTSKLNLSPVWDDWNRRVAARMFTDKILGICEKGKANLTLKDRQYLSKYRIPLSKVDAIKAQYEKYGVPGEKGKHLRIAKTQHWEDQELVDTFGSAMVTHSYNTILMPNSGDVPLALHTVGGKMSLAYRSYQFAFQNNVLADWAAQGQCRRAVAGLMGIWAVSALGKMLKKIAAGDPINVEDCLIDAALDTPFAPLDAIRTVYRFGSDVIKRDASYGLGQFFGSAPMSTPVRLFDSFSSISKSVFTGRPISENNGRRILREIPLSGLPGVKAIGNAMVHEAVDSTGGKLINWDKR